MLHASQIGATGAGRRKLKYGNTPTIVDGIRFDSKREASRWQYLLLLQRGRQITDLKRQVRFKLEVNGQLVCTYVADFTYVDRAGCLIVEDVKSEATRTDRVYRLKAKLLKALRGIEITEVA